jgi:RNA recognition motif-containing protein
VNAQRAKEALHGTLIGGMPIRINDATRKARDLKVSQYVGAAASSTFSPPAAPTAPAAAPSSIYGPSSNVAIASNHTSVLPTVPPMPQINADSYRDDKGNPATKNLFVAGYGPGTTEIQLRQLFSQYAQVTGVVLKGTFSFVNTSKCLFWSKF